MHKVYGTRQANYQGQFVVALEFTSVKPSWLAT
jgi:hypothetical protein